MKFTVFALAALLCRPVAASEPVVTFSTAGDGKFAAVCTALIAGHERFFTISAKGETEFIFPAVALDCEISTEDTVEVTLSNGRGARSQVSVSDGRVTVGVQ